MTAYRIALPGVNTDPAGIKHIADVLADTESFKPGWSLLVGGMEHLRSPFLLLQNVDGRKLFVLERRNDDGEWAPLTYEVDEDLDLGDNEAIRHAASSVGEWAQELGEGEAGLLVDDGPDPYEALSDLLYLYRDIISPDALA
jgi:hypothetical protein